MIDHNRKELITTDTILNSKVVNPAHEELGQVEDIAIDPVNGNIVYAVLTFGGFMGFGEKRFAMPWEAFYLDTIEDEKIILNVTKEKLEDAPGLEKDEMPVAGQWEFVDNIYRHYGYSTYTSRRPIGRTHGDAITDQPTSTLSHNAGLGNSGEAATFDQAGFESNRIKESGIS